MFRKLRFFLTIVFSLIFICFAVLNRQFVSISLFPLPYSADMPLFIFAVLCFAMGILAGSVYVSAKAARLKRLLKLQHKHVTALQNEIGGLRTEKSDLLPAVAEK